MAPKYELYYHSTTLTAWNEHICHEGLKLQPIVDDEDERGNRMGPVFDQVGLPHLALCMWPACVVSEQLFHDFMFWKWSHEAEPSCVVLQCQVPPHFMLHYQVNLQGDTLSTTHTQSCTSKHDTKVWFHRNVPLAYLTQPLPRELIRPIRRVYVKLDNMPGDRFAPDSSIPERGVNYAGAKLTFMAPQHKRARKANERGDDNNGRSNRSVL